MPMSRISAASTRGQGVRPVAGRRVGSSSRAALQVPLGRGLEGEPERLGRGQRHRHPVGDDRLVLRVALGAVVADPAGDRVGVGVRDVHAGVAEAQPGEGRGHRHLLARLGVVAVADGASGTPRPAATAPSPTTCPRPGWRRSRAPAPRAAWREPGVPARGVALEGVAEDVHPGRRGDHRRLGHGQRRGRRRRAWGAAGGG